MESKPTLYINDSSVLGGSPVNDRVHENDFPHLGEIEFPPLSCHSSRKQEGIDREAYRSTAIYKNSNCRSDHPNTSVQQSPQHNAICEISEVILIDADSHCCNSLHLSSSLDLLISAERIINDSQFLKTHMDDDDTGLNFDEDHFGLNAVDSGNNLADTNNEKSRLLQGHHRKGLTGSQTSLFRSVS